ncbi:lysosomal alpha-glucosidase-like [Ornithodoros turicata]|uniref:lysosomal alpha-glucosidase-like n=1 Tax=Ornithodoros turicata TaxID=34597 RepID=UPI0031389007
MATLEETKKTSGLKRTALGIAVVIAFLLVASLVTLACQLTILKRPRNIKFRHVQEPEPTASLMFPVVDLHPIISALLKANVSVPVARVPRIMPQVMPAAFHVSPQRKTTAGAVDKEVVIISTPACAAVWDTHRLDCHADGEATAETCYKRGCCYDKTNSTDGPLEPGLIQPPACFYPTNYVGYKLVSLMDTPTRTAATFKRVTPSGIPGDVNVLQVQVIRYDTNIVRIRLVDPNVRRYEVPYPNVPDQERQLFGIYDATVTPDGEIQIARISSRKFVFHTNVSTLVYTSQFLQLTTQLPSRYVYGIGDSKSPLLRSTEWNKITLFNFGRSPAEGKNLYGSHPFVLVHEETGETSGIFLLNSNAMDVILQPSPAVTFRTTGGILDLFVLLGPTPASVVQQYTAIVGRPFMPPYWSLGFHLSRWGYESIEEVFEVWKRNVKAGVPIEAMWLDEDYMDDLRPFSYDHTRFQGLPEYARELHKRDTKLVITLHPGIDSTRERGTYLPYEEGDRRDVFIRMDNGNYNYGRLGNRTGLVFPDFTHPASRQYWRDMLSYFHDAVPFDGIGLDLNEPSSFTNESERRCPPDNSLEHPPFLPGDGRMPLHYKTLCMSSRQYVSRHYDVHNLYGYTQALRTYDGLSQIMFRRPFVVSRASFAGQGAYSGHWSGDIESDWDSLRYSVASMLTFNMLGMPMTGSDICGFWDNVTAELCQRWHAVGAFYPFSRNHNAKGSMDQDPAAWGMRMSQSIRQIIRIRYNFLPYLYTLLYRSHAFGDTVARPLFFEFPNDVNTFGIDTQFLWGSSLLILPILEPNTTVIKPYIPHGIWYDTLLGTAYHSACEDFDVAPHADLVCLLIRGGSVIPTQETAQTTTASRLKPFSLLVAIDNDNAATGEMYWDDGESLGSYERGDYSLIKFVVLKGTLIGYCVHCKYEAVMVLNGVVLYGAAEKPAVVSFNGEPAYFSYSPAGQFVKVVNLHYQITRGFKMTWSN